MRLQSLKLTDFASFEKIEIDLAQFGDEPVLIIGENRDSPGANSNGSAKSSLLHGIVWTLLGKIPGGGSVDSMVRRGTEKCRGTVKLLDDSNLISVTRTRPLGHKGKLVWRINGEKQEYSTPTASQKALTRRLGFHPATALTDYLNSACFSTEAMSAFTSGSGGSEERMAIIARFLGLDVLDIARDLAREQKNEGAGEVKATKTLIAQLEADIDEDAFKKAEEKSEVLVGELGHTHRLSENVQSLLKQARRRDDFQGKLNLVESQLSTIDTRYSTAADQLADGIQQESLTLGTVIAEFEALQKLEETAEYIPSEAITEKIAEVDETTQRSAIKATKTRGDKTRLEDLVRSLKKQIESSQLCPTCEAPLQTDSYGNVSAFDAASLEKNIEQLNKQIAVFSSVLSSSEIRTGELDEIKGQLVSARDEMLELEKQFETKLNLQLSLQERNTSIEQKQDLLKSLSEKQEEEERKLEGEVADLKAQLEKYFEVEPWEILDARHERFSQRTREINSEIQELSALIAGHRTNKDRLATAQTRLNLLATKHEAVDFWAEGFPTIRRWRIDRFLPEFESEVNSILSQMDFGARVSLSTTKERKRSRGKEDSTRAAFSIDVTDPYGLQGEFETFSAGESRRIGMAVGFALRELTARRGTNQLEFLLVDELVDSLDELGVENFFRVLPMLGGLKLIITHDPGLASMIERVIKVTKENGISTVSTN